jgi:hypothetical protein
MAVVEILGTPKFAHNNRRKCRKFQRREMMMMVR